MNPDEVSGHNGYHDNYGGSGNFMSFDVGNKHITYQIRERQGNVIFNNRGQIDCLSSSCLTYNGRWIQFDLDQTYHYLFTR